MAKLRFSTIVAASVLAIGGTFATGHLCNRTAQAAVQGGADAIPAASTATRSPSRFNFASAAAITAGPTTVGTAQAGTGAATPIGSDLAGAEASAGTTGVARNSVNTGKSASSTIAITIGTAIATGVTITTATIGGATRTVSAKKSAPGLDPRAENATGR